MVLPIHKSPANLLRADTPHPKSPVTLPAFMPSHNRRNVSWCYGLRYFPKGGPLHSPHRCVHP